MVDSQHTSHYETELGDKKGREDAKNKPGEDEDMMAK